MTKTRRFFLGSLAGMAGAGVAAGQQRGAASLARNRVSPLDGVTREKIRITDIKLTNLA